MGRAGYADLHVYDYRDSPEERDKGEEPSPVLMLRNLKEEVRKEDVSGGFINPKGGERTSTHKDCHALALHSMCWM